jgi:murein DD-endopeptidase MepM/ murein hydrolase activator NlpD
VDRWEKLQFILRSLPLTAPIDSYYISSAFGARMDPFNGERAIHEGIDMVSKLRSDVLATAPGTVIFAGWKGGYGRVVEIDHGLGIVTRYAHLYAINVKVGDVVDYRQEIGKLGSSGRSSGPHVHFEVRYNGRPLDPMSFLKAGRYVFKG